jgi:UDP-N-acetylglucosamine--N-acetylmuramyl-(pentapeptide) pyrophosphoryl-undecaprenol N-acetylglucosamine transferase
VLTNRVLACLADKVLVAFPAAFRNQQDKPLPCRKVETEWCGNPVRADIATLNSPRERFAGRSGKLRLLVVGGSLGAQALNETVPRALALLPQEQRPEVVHQAGLKHFETLKSYYAEAGVTADVRPFIDDMAQLYAWCDLVVCRAGALTVAELAAAGVASVLVPYPFAVDDHQTTNGKFLSDHAAAVLLQQTQLNPERLAELLGEVTREKLLSMAEAARELAKTEATQRVAQVCMELAA